MASNVINIQPVENTGPSLIYDLEMANARQKDSAMSLQTEYIIRELEKLKGENQELRKMMLSQ